MLIDLSVMIPYQHLNGEKYCNRDTVRTENKPMRCTPEVVHEITR